MPTIAAITEELQRALQGGVAPDDSRLNDEDYLEQKINEYSEKAISLAYTGSKSLGANKSIDPKVYLPFDLNYELALNPDPGACYVDFRCPEMIQIASYLDGFAFVGDKLTMKPISKLKNPAELSTVMAVGTNGATYFAQIGGKIRVIGNMDLRVLSVIGRPKNPMGLANTYYNPSIDEYPMPDGLIPLMIQMMKAEEFGLIISTPQDNKSDEKGG